MYTVVRPVERRVRLFGLCAILAGRWLGCGLRGRVSDQVAVFAFVSLDFSGGGLGDDGEGGRLAGPYPKQAQVEFNASDGGGSADRVGSRADHELVGDHGNAYSLQNSDFIEHAEGAKVPKKQAE